MRTPEPVLTAAEDREDSMNERRRYQGSTLSHQQITKLLTQKLLVSHGGYAKALLCAACPGLYW